MAFTTLNPSDKNTGITLSNGNLTATNNNNVQVQGVRAINGYSIGKYYWECIYNTTTNVCNAVGICKSSVPLNTQMNNSTSGMGYCTVVPYLSGGIWNDGAQVVTSFGTIANGSLICVAVDCAAQLVWFRLGATGNWNNSGTANPASGVGGIAVSMGNANPIFPLVQVSNMNDQITANFGGSAFTGAVPIGFGAGASTTTAFVTQVSLEQFAAPNPQAQITQVALEQWANVPFVPVQAIVTQVALEQWVMALQAGAQARVMVMA